MTDDWTPEQKWADTVRYARAQIEKHGPEYPVWRDHQGIVWAADHIQELEDAIREAVHMRRMGTVEAFGKSLDALQELLPDEDPTPWCNACGAMEKERCHCGPIADND